MPEPRHGYRGYIGSRPYDGERTPQHVQNLVIRDYAQRRKLPFLLSLTEFCMPGCYMMLHDALGDLPHTKGIIIFSLLMLPRRPDLRQQIYDRILSTDSEMHAALQDIVIRNTDDVGQVEEILLVHHALARNSAPRPDAG